MLLYCFIIYVFIYVIIIYNTYIEEFGLHMRYFDNFLQFVWLGL